MICVCKDFCPMANSVDCSEKCVKYLELKYLLDNSLIPVKRQKFEQMKTPVEDEKQYANLRKIVENIKKYIDKGTNFVLYSGRTGNGKTSWAINLLLAYFNEVWAGNGFKHRGYFIYVPDFINRVKASISVPDEQLQSIMQDIKDIDILVLDDIGTNAMSEYDISLLSSIIDQRILRNKSTIFTTNCDEKALKKILGERMSDRIWNSSVIIEFNGKSQRGML